MEGSMASKKGKKGKLPKEIAGIKIPKELRKTGEALIATANSPIARDLMMSGAAAMMATVAARMRGDSQQPGKGAAETAPTPAPQPGQPQANGTGATGFDAEAAGAQAARRIIEVFSNAVQSSRRPPDGNASGS